MDHIIREAIVLAGGKGTRLRSEVGDTPKPLAPINNVPFLDYIFNFLIKNGILKAVLSVGYNWEKIYNHYGSTFKTLSLEYSVEETPLGTGGAIKLALKKIESDHCYIINGDTLFDINLLRLQNFHFNHNATCSIALKHLENVDRYGSIKLTDNSKISAFEEKQFRSKTLINGGTYLINKTIQIDFPNQANFSFESDYLEVQPSQKTIFGLTFKDYFIDIGIPEDYKKFQKKVTSEIVPTPSLNRLPIDKTWTLFLDRDGVFNHQIINDYVKQVHELKIIDGVPEAVSHFTKIFGRIVIVTNQQGIGKKLMTVDDLNHLNGFILNLIETYGGKIDKIYFAPQLASDKSNYRKPGTGMGLHAQVDFPEIDFKKSVMIGDSEGDIEFGTKLGMKTIMLKNSRNLSTKANYIFENLYDVSNNLK